MLPTVIVSGSPRSGTTLMMRVLGRGGLDLIVDLDATKPLNENHPYGTFEIHKAAHRLHDMHPTDTAGRVIKLVAPIVNHDLWPTDRKIKVVFMLRDPQEIVASMLASNIVWDRTPQEMVWDARNILSDVGADVLDVKYHDLCTYPRSEITRIADFLEMEDFNIDNAVGAIDTNARNKLRDDINLVTFQPPTLKQLRPDEEGGIIGTVLEADNMTPEERAAFEAKTVREKELAETAQPAL